MKTRFPDATARAPLPPGVEAPNRSHRLAAADHRIDRVDAAK
jgi:hypothetical protein